MKQYSFYHGFFLSFISGKFYQDVAQQWSGICFWYLVLLMLITSLISSMKILSNMGVVDQQTLAPFTSQFVPIHIQDGEASCDAPQPHFIRESQFGDPIVIIDTKDMVDESEFENVFVIRQDELVIKQPNKTQSLPLSTVEELLGGPTTIDQQWMDATILYWYGLFKMLFFPLWFGLSFVYRFMEAIVLGLIGLAIAALRKTNLHFGQTLRLSVMALTPVVIFNTIFELFSLTGPATCVWNLVCLGLPLGYVIFAVGAASAKPVEKTSSDLDNSFGQPNQSF